MWAGAQAQEGLCGCDTAWGVTGGVSGGIIPVLLTSRTSLPGVDARLRFRLLGQEASLARGTCAHPRAHGSWKPR